MPRRMCEDCGIAPWQDCVCDDDAGLDHPRSPYLERATPIFASVNGSACHPKDGDPGAVPQGDESPASAADPSCAEREDPSCHVDGNTGHDPARDPYPRSRAGSGRTDRRAA
jgi:hypothetical protein